ncbi:MAG: helix-turn-helix domain-containing protein [Nitrospiraceae bacterium]
MGDIYKFVGDKIHALRKKHGEDRITQEQLAEAMETSANTISRWETAIYKPSVKDLDRLARFFGVSIATFFPEEENPLLKALTSATRSLKKDDLEVLTEYARFRSARRKLGQTRKEKNRRK